MNMHILTPSAFAILFGLATAAVSVPAQADNIWDMMDPTWWLGFDDDDDDWRYWRYGPGDRHWNGPWGWGGPYAWNPAYFPPPPDLLAENDRGRRKEPAPKLPE